ncbi:uncharacterized protein LOC129600094 isoform X2 [Paramacrobiotus metropolitanus]|uniref:uncharacterized protein LOC129600094 isoform X2 n=1 Tax=Paramacrobiotus metropolitanus TaxID=2943436 RepID=UPI0024465BD0|nr:uncharacterized protein LOC129600094 isoform X2 [Paramacrobiotus metropolitanus]
MKTAGTAAILCVLTYVCLKTLRVFMKSCKRSLKKAWHILFLIGVTFILVVEIAVVALIIRKTADSVYIENLEESARHYSTVETSLNADGSLKIASMNHTGIRENVVDTTIVNALQLYLGCCGTHTGHSDFDETPYHSERFPVLPPPVFCCKFNNTLRLKLQNRNCFSGYGRYNAEMSNFQSGCVPAVIELVKQIRWIPYFVIATIVSQVLLTLFLGRTYWQLETRWTKSKQVVELVRAELEEQTLHSREAREKLGEVLANRCEHASRHTEHIEEALREKHPRKLQQEIRKVSTEVISIIHYMDAMLQHGLCSLTSCTARSKSGNDERHAQKLKEIQKFLTDETQSAQTESPISTELESYWLQLYECCHAAAFEATTLPRCNDLLEYMRSLLILKRPSTLKLNSFKESLLKIAKEMEQDIGNSAVSDDEATYGREFSKVRERLVEVTLSLLNSTDALASRTTNLESPVWNTFRDNKTEVLKLLRIIRNSCQRDGVGANDVSQMIERTESLINKRNRFLKPQFIVPNYEFNNGFKEITKAAEIFSNLSSELNPPAQHNHLIHLYAGCQLLALEAQIRREKSNILQRYNIFMRRNRRWVQLELVVPHVVNLLICYSKLAQGRSDAEFRQELVENAKFVLKSLEISAGKLDDDHSAIEEHATSIRLLSRHAEDYARVDANNTRLQEETV